MQWSSGAGLRVLLLEDDRALSQVVTEFLASEGITVVAVADRNVALRLAREGGWDACIADCSPFSNGELYWEDRALFAALSAVAPLILATGRAWTRDISAAELGVAAILQKPFDLQVLVEEVLATRKMAGARRAQAART